LSTKTIESRPYPKLVVINGRDQNQLRGVATPEYYFQFYPGTEETWVDDKEEYIKSMLQYVKSDIKFNR
jgi:hypothetical protein